MTLSDIIFREYVRVNPHGVLRTHANIKRLCGGSKVYPVTSTVKVAEAKLREYIIKLVNREQKFGYGLSDTDIKDEIISLLLNEDKYSDGRQTIDV